ncbi:MAG: FGGY-family carbohydrate kinase [Deltaproteobacteria bacterium]|nr:FGGY-family carbohydrate kinase [Candidatus Zymogenaceae bacterium]
MTDESTLVLALDVGTTGCKTCLFRIGKTVEQLDNAVVEYPLYMTEDGGAEQKVDEWWDALCRSTKMLLDRGKVTKDAVAGMAFSCQMQGSVLVDKSGQALHNPMTYMDSRSTEQIARYLYRGLFRIEGWNARLTVRSLLITGGLAATPKDPLWKYHWVKDNRPDIFEKAYKWLDVKDYLVLRCTGNYGMTYDSAHLTFVYDTRPGKLGWHKGLCRTFDVNMDHLPPVVASTDVVGTLTEQAASDLGLKPGIPVFGGGGDTSMTAVGAGCVTNYDTHIYIGTSGWVLSNFDKRKVDVGNFIASILGPIPGLYCYVAEAETAGACLQWVRDHLALDEIGVYLEEHPAKDPEAKKDRLFELLNRAVSDTEPGAGGVIFTPWLHGSRSPREDAYARGIFFNLGLNTGKRMLIRAVLEGVAYHDRWMLEAVEKQIPRRETVRLVGGGAKSEEWCQIMADVTGRKIETVRRPQDVGAMGAAVVCGVGLGIIEGFEAASDFIQVDRTYEPRAQYREMYDRNFAVFKDLYEKNKKLFRRMNERDQS